MRKTTLLALTGYIGFIALVFWACGGHSPTSPSFGASPVPIGPKPAPIGPSPRPVGPSPIAGGPSTSPGGGGNTPGGGATPTPTPTPTVPCPPTLTLIGTGTPRLLSGAINDNSLFPKGNPNYGFDCVVKEVKVTMHVTTVTGFVNTPFPGYTDPNATLGVCGGGVGFSGCSASGLYSFQSNASGNQIGTNCGDFVFDTTASTVFNPASPPPPPYSGTYQLDPGSNGVGDEWYLRSIDYEFINTFNHPPDTVLECARIDITTKIVVP